MERDLTVRNSRNVQEIVHQLDDPANLALDNLPAGLELIRLAPSKDLQGRHDRRDGIAKFMSESRDEFILTLICLLEDLFGLYRSSDVNRNTHVAKIGSI